MSAGILEECEDRLIARASSAVRCSRVEKIREKLDGLAFPSEDKPATDTFIVGHPKLRPVDGDVVPKYPGDANSTVEAMFKAAVEEVEEDEGHKKTIIFRPAFSKIPSKSRFADRAEPEFKTVDFREKMKAMWEKSKTFVAQDEKPQGPPPAAGEEVPNLSNPASVLDTVRNLKESQIEESESLYYPMHPSEAVHKSHSSAWALSEMCNTILTEDSSHARKIANLNEAVFSTKNGKLSPMVYLKSGSGERDHRVRQGQEREMLVQMDEACLKDEMRRLQERFPESAPTDPWQGSFLK